jgi:hypothetical protein
MVFDSGHTAPIDLLISGDTEMTGAEDRRGDDR